MSASDAIEPVAALVARRTGLCFPENRREAFRAAVANAIARTRARTARDLVGVLESVPAALDELVAELTVHESYFFRYPGQFEVLRRTVLPEILRRRGGDHGLRLLSLGCAAGEEPYSLAVLLEQEGLSDRAVIVGADISRPSLERAAQASYGSWSLRGTTEEFRARYFKREGSRFRLIRQIRERVELTYLNLAEEFPPRNGPAGFDVIFCRNALIYFDAGTIAGAAARIFSALAEGGWLFTAASDPPLSDHAPFATVMTPEGLLYRRLEENGLELALEGSQALREASLLAEPPGVPLVEPLRPSAELAPRARRRKAPRPAAPAAKTSRTAHIRALADEGRIVDALEAAEAASRSEPDSAELHYLRAVLLSETGRDRDAADALRRVLYLDGQLAVAALALGLALRRLGDHKESRRALTMARALVARRPVDEPVALADGEIAGRLLITIDAQLRLLEKT